jgi:hypothetical protein
MRYKGFARYLQSWLLGLFFIFSFCSNIEAFDFSGWDGLVKKYVAPKTLDGVSINAIDYAGLKKDPEFSDLVFRLDSYPLESLNSRESKLTFWINVYNILAAKMITDNYPIESIKDAGSFFKPVWKRPAGRVGGKEYTLNIIEHEILRKMKEPRIHVAIVCASISCPDLRPEAYTVEKLNGQLDDQMEKFLSSREKGMRLDENKNRVYLSSIFKWFEEDFENGVLKYIGRHVTPEQRLTLNKPKIKISYLDYNWKINGH